MRFKGQRYCKSRLKFGQNIVPLIMRSVLEAVLAQNKMIRRVTSAYIADMTIMKKWHLWKLQKYLKRYGLLARIQRGCKTLPVFGLEVWEEDSQLRWPWEYEISFLCVPNSKSTFQYVGGFVWSLALFNVGPLLSHRGGLMKKKILLKILQWIQYVFLRTRYRGWRLVIEVEIY